MMKSDAQPSRVLHVVIERTSLRCTLNVPNTYAQRAARRVTIARTVQLLNVNVRSLWAPSERLPVRKLRERSNRLAEHFDVDQINNSGQEGATHVDRPRLIRCQLSCFFL